MHLRPLGDVGQVVPVQANLRYPDSVARAIHGAGIVINLVGIGFERGAQRFEAVNVAGARAVAEAARDAGAQILIHMSILGADPNSPSAFARSRAAAELAVAAAFPAAHIMRPSIIFGNGDGFASQMASVARLLPAMPLIGGKTKFQPVYVGDVADAFGAATAGAGKPGRIYELGGPEVLTHRELLERVFRDAGRHPLLVPLPAGIAKLLALPMRLLPRPPLTADQVDLLQVDNVVSAEAVRSKRSLSGLGVTPTPMEAIFPSYLWRFRPHGQFDQQAA
jgi:NADH dehydrogenase